VHFSSPAVEEVFTEYETRDTDERARALSLGSRLFEHRDEFLLPVGREVGWFLHSLILAKRPARVLELGTSGTLITMELAGYKQAAARTMIERAGIAAAVDFRLGDAVALINADAGPFDLVLLDIWKDLYVACLRAFYPKLADEGIIAADNMIEPAMVREDARKYRAAVGSLPDVQTTLLPIGSGIELSVKWSPANRKL
jgi:predicted O-methyltransferase YrrM